MSWIELKLNFPQDRLEDVSAYLFALGCEGINVTESGIVIYFATHKWTKEVQKGMVEFLRHFEPNFSNRNIQVAALAEHDWLSDWKKGFRPIRIGERIIVKPPWDEYHAREGECVLTINPEMAFGTGHHESTKLMIIEIEKTLRPDMRVLDVGTGSGILAILAKKMNAASVMAVDNDIEAVRNAQNNARLNQVTGGLMIALGEFADLPDNKYDMILANINRNMLIQSADSFARFLETDGILIISGLLISDESAILPVYLNSGFKLIRKTAMKEWLACVFKLERKKSDDEPGRNRYRDQFNPASDRPVE